MTNNNKNHTKGSIKNRSLNIDGNKGETTTTIITTRWANINKQKPYARLEVKKPLNIYNMLFLSLFLFLSRFICVHAMARQEGEKNLFWTINQAIYFESVQLSDFGQTVIKLFISYWLLSDLRKRYEWPVCENLSHTKLLSQQWYEIDNNIWILTILWQCDFFFFGFKFICR